MYLLDLFKKEADIDLKPLLIVSVLSGISNAALLATINSATTNGSEKTDDLRLMFISILCIALFILTKKYVLKKSVFIVEDIVRKMRCRIVNKVRHSELLEVENIGTADIYSRITRDAVQVSHSAETMTNGFQALIMVLCTVGYIAFLSIPSVLIIVLYFVLGTYAYLRLSGVGRQLLEKATKKEESFFDSLNSILNGFKEVKVNKKKNQGVYNEFVNVTKETRDLYVGANNKFITSYLFAQSFFYILLTVIVFLIPMYFETTNTDMIKISAAILFIVGPMETLVSSIPVVMACNIAAMNIVRLEEKLETTISENDLEHMNNPDYVVEPLPFEDEIVLNKMQFAYPKGGFEVGPISLSIDKGKITFISGGNGAGKSTFLKLFTGMYYPQGGSIKLDGKTINTDNYHNYRELFSVIFTDFFLFERLHGLEHVDQKTIDDLLKTLQISDKTKIANYTIFDRNLSTGQRKRLALAVSLLENKTIYVFDEVAADQDPVFKKYFYRKLLPEMKKQGKTMVVVTHDDLYFDACDVHYKLADGGLRTKDSGTGK
jgi:putative ATP-binding cassette transporter